MHLNGMIIKLFLRGISGLVQEEGGGAWQIEYRVYQEFRLKLGGKLRESFYASLLTALEASSIFGLQE